MLTPEQIDKLPNRVMEYWEQAEYDIIADIARRMQKAGQVTNTAEWQMWRLKEVGIARSDILTILASTLNKSQGEIIKSFDECCTEALNSDDKLYKEAGFTPIPLQDNPLMQGIILAGLKETNGTYQNLTATTANTASRQFENILDQMNLRIASGAFTYQEAIKAGISELSQQGIQSITYPSGHIDYLDVAFRRATVTGMSKTANNLQMQRLDELDIDLVEVTAHPGARPSHAVWQGGIYSRSGKSKKYRSLITATGYGTGAGLGGWNCRHSFYPYIPGVSTRIYDKKKLKEINNKTVSYNGKDIPLYEARDKQRSIERQIRRWKREKAALEAIGEDASKSNAKIRHWQSVQRDFTSQTGLKRDYFRERGGKQLTGGPIQH